MRANLSAFAAAAAGAIGVSAAVLWGAAPALADGAWIEVNPSSIQAGFRVGIRASCQDNLNPATVKSDAFGEITLAPENGFLVGAATIPSNKRAGAYTVELTCANGSSASTTLNVIGMERPTHGPATGGGGTAPTGTGPLVLAGGLADPGARRRRRRHGAAAPCLLAARAGGRRTRLRRPHRTIRPGWRGSPCR
jgi:hypothetical protein